MQYAPVGILISSTEPASFAEQAGCILCPADPWLVLSSCREWSVSPSVHLATLAAPPSLLCEVSLEPLLRVVTSHLTGI